MDCDVSGVCSGVFLSGLFLSSIRGHSGRETFAPLLWDAFQHNSGMPDCNQHQITPNLPMQASTKIQGLNMPKKHQNRMTEFKSNENLGLGVCFEIKFGNPEKYCQNLLLFIYFLGNPNICLKKVLDGTYGF